MKKIDDKIVVVGDKPVTISIFKLDEHEPLEEVSRVYVIGANESGEVVLIYNSKRNIWGFPGGHVERGESVLETARREFIEEAHRDIEGPEVRYLLVHQLDGDHRETYTICFAVVGREDRSFVAQDETVTQVKYVPLNEVVGEIGNPELWTHILDDFQGWLLRRST